MNVTLLVVQGKPAGKKLVFPTGEYYFGRGVECHVRPESDWVSRQHCLLRVAAHEVYLRDLGSRNGTLVNGELLTTERELRVGDHIQVGPLVFEVRSGEPDLVPINHAEQQTKIAAADQTVPDRDKPASNSVLATTVHLPTLDLEKQAPLQDQ